MLSSGVAKSSMVQSGRAASQFIPVPTTPKPSPEEFDPLNPGEWQMGVSQTITSYVMTIEFKVGGKILPRLPIGTKVGPLVMGKYGLYHPTARLRGIEFLV
jgi:hypothetical protein